MQKACICYVIDQNYLFPTLVSASQARKHTPADKADVVIICISPPCEAFDISKSVADELGIAIIRRDLSDIDNLHPMFGRLFIADLLPQYYQRVVYIDGDTQIAGSLEPLLNARFEANHFLAVRDPGAMYAQLSHRWRIKTQQDRTSAGLTSIDDYFNTGVLVFNLDNWRHLCAETLRVVRDRRDTFKFGDQDPMNLAIGDRCVYIPNRWNFPGFLIGSLAEKTSAPIIYHFMSNPRPWLHSGQPWGRKWAQPYVEFRNRFPNIKHLAPNTTKLSALKYHTQQFIKSASEYRPVSRIPEQKPELQI